MRASNTCLDKSQNPLGVTVMALPFLILPHFLTIRFVANNEAGRV